MALLSKPVLLWLFSCSRACCAFATAPHPPPDARDGDVADAHDGDDEFFPPLIASDDIAYFFSNDDLDGLHWALTSVFDRSARNPRAAAQRELPPSLVARGGGDFYTSEYKLRHDLAQARYLVEALAEADPRTAAYFAAEVIPIYERVLRRIPPLAELERTKGLYAFTQRDYASGIGSVYNKALYATTAADVDAGWNDRSLLNENLDWERLQREYFGESAPAQAAGPQPGVIVLDDVLTPRVLALLRRLLLRNTHWFQTKTPLEFGKYVGAYVDDGLHDPVFLALARELQRRLPRLLRGHPLRYLWAYKYDSEFESGINLHADQAAVNVNLWLSSEGADLEEEGYGGGLVVFTAKPPSHWDFEAYNTNTEVVVEELLRPNDFANVTVKHRPNRAVIFDSALFHQTDRYKFRRGYENGRINLTLLFGEMRADESGGAAASSAGTKQEL